MTIPSNKSASRNGSDRPEHEAAEIAMKEEPTPQSEFSDAPCSSPGHHEHVEKHKFVGRSREREVILKSMSRRPPVEPPAEVLRYSEILGLDATTFTAEDIHRAWRKAISSPDVHPDLGGKVETAILINTAKDSLTKWLDSFAPKLGKQFSHLK